MNTRRRFLLSFLPPLLLVACSRNESPVAATPEPAGASPGSAQLPSAAADPSLPQPHAALPNAAPLALAASGSPGHRTLTITLTNTTGGEILVDRQLSILLKVSATGGDGSAVAEQIPDTETVRSLPAEERATRFVNIPPGQALSRTIDLDTGFKQFSFFTWAHADTPNQAIHGVIVGESLRRLSPDDHPTALTVHYGNSRNGLHQALGLFTGDEALGLFNTPLDATLSPLPKDW